MADMSVSSSTVQLGKLNNYVQQQGAKILKASAARTSEVASEAVQQTIEMKRQKGDLLNRLGNNLDTFA